MLANCLDLFLPTYCLTCSEVLVRGEEWVCTSCYYDLPQTAYHHYADNTVVQRLYGRVPLSCGMAMYQFRQKSKVQKLLHHLKYKHQPTIGQWLGRRYGMLLKEVHLDKSFDLIIPVPLHRNRMRQRGYNQSAYFAWGITEVLDIPWNDHCLRRVKDTATQTRKGQEERINNVADAFCVMDPAVVKGKRLLLVDDIITTGATLEACSVALLANNVLDISIATIAVVV